MMKEERMSDVCLACGKPKKILENADGNREEICTCCDSDKPTPIQDDELREKLDATRIKRRANPHLAII